MSKDENWYVPKMDPDEYEIRRLLKLNNPEDVVDRGINLLKVLVDSGKLSEAEALLGQVRKEITDCGSGLDDEDIAVYMSAIQDYYNIWVSNYLKDGDYYLRAVQGMVPGVTPEEAEKEYAAKSEASREKQLKEMKIK
jgi:hypothetical protein